MRESFVSTIAIRGHDRKGQYAVRVSGNWRVFFEFVNGNAYIVDYGDYH